MENSSVIALDADGDGHVSVSEIFDYLVKVIRMAESFDDYTAQGKHVYVLRIVRQFIGEEDFHKHFDYIDGAIIFILNLSKHPRLLDGINQTKKCLSKWCK